MCDTRENIYTHFAKCINDFVEHKLTKVQLYDAFCTAVEIANDEEKKARLEYQKYDSKEGNIFDLLRKDQPFFMYNEGKKMLE